MSVPPVPPHRLVGDIGLIDDHNLIVDVANDAQTRLAGHDTALTTKANLPKNSARAVGQNEQRINVTYFQTGSLTDTQMINAAETFRTTFHSGGELYFPSGGGSASDGAYILDPASGDAVSLTSTSVGLVGDGRGRSIIRMKSTAGDYNSFFRYTGTDGTYLMVRHLTFDGNSANNLVTAALPLGQKRIVVELNTGTKLTVQGCEFINCNGTWTVYAANACADLEVSGNLFNNIGANSIDIDTSTVYFVGQRAQIHHNTFMGGGIGAKTAMEIHGDDQNVHNNIVVSYYAIGNLVGDHASSITQHWHHNSGHHMGSGIQVWPIGGVGNSTAWGFEHATIEENYIEIDYDLWSFVTSHRFGIGNSSTLSTLGMRGLRILNNTIRYLPFTSTPSATDNLSAGILLFRSSAYAGSDDNITISGNTIISPVACGIYISLNNTVTNRLNIVGDNTILNPGFNNAAAFSTSFKVGILLSGAFTDCSIVRPKIIDDRGTHIMPEAIHMANVTTAINCELIDVNMRVADGVAIPEFLGATSGTAAFYVRYRSNNYLAPAKPTLAGSTILDQSGVLHTQATAPYGTGWVSGAGSVSLGNWRATDNSLVGASGDPLYAGGTAAMTNAGVANGAKFKLDATGVITNVLFNCSIAAAGLTSAWVAIYDAAGTLLGQTADLSTALTVGLHTIAFLSPTVTKNAGDFVEVLIATIGTTAPTLRGFAASSVTFVGGSAPFRFFTYSTGLTTPPSPITPASGASTSVQPFFALT